MGRIRRVQGWLLAAAVGAGMAGPAQAQGRLAARWLGQDKHDYCGTREAIKPNGFQDVHIVLSGLPPRREIAAIWIRGFGGGEWQYQGVQNNHGMVLIRKPGSPTADLFLEPYQSETGRAFDVVVKFDDGREESTSLRGGKANPDLRMADAAMSAKWVGQGKQDRAALGPAVGPDGLQDARIVFSRLTPGDKVAAVTIETRNGSKWSAGPNPEGHHNAELIVNEKTPTEAHLDFQPDKDLAGQTLRVTLTYASGKKDEASLVAGKTDPKLAMPAVAAPKVADLKLSARWVGQDGTNLTGSGDVHVSVAGLPTKGVAAAVLSDGIRGVWVHKAGERVPLDVEDGAGRLAFKPGRDRSSGELFFAPIRNETGATMTLRLVLADGTFAAGSFPGGVSEPALKAPPIDRSEATARPGDDIAALATRGGTVRLAKGNHSLSKPLILPRPVMLVGEPGTILTFSQAASDAPWTTAIKIHAGNTTLKDFAVRFAGPVRFKSDVAWGPAVIGTTDNLDGIDTGLKVNIVLSGLDIDGPEKTGSAPWEESIRLIRLHGAECGKVLNNRLRGGLIHLFGGPWEVAGNDYRGTHPGTFSGAVFVVHEPHDVVVRNNRAKPVAPCGKTWRFLTFVQRGSNDLVENNTIEDIGPREGDTIPSMNCPEIILTESYFLWFEGKPSAISADGRVVKIDRVALMPARSGDVVSVLSGPNSGQWRRVAQRIDATTYLLETPLPKGAATAALSISPGFVGEKYVGNTILAPGGKDAGGFVLAGNHFGTLVKGNRVVGAGEAILAMASASEAPNGWGWSHVPVLGMVVEDNVVEDSERGSIFGVSHGGLCKSNKGRVYMGLALKNNTVKWSDGYLSRRSGEAAKTPLAGITLGYKPALDPGELVVEEQGNRLVASGRAAAVPALRVHAAVVNGKPIVEKSLKLGERPSPASAGRESQGVTPPSRR